MCVIYCRILLDGPRESGCTLCPPLGWVQGTPGCCWGAAALPEPRRGCEQGQAGQAVPRAQGSLCCSSPMAEVTWRGLCSHLSNCLVPEPWLGAAALRLFTSSFLEVRSPEWRNGYSLQGRELQKRLIFSEASKHSNKIHHLVKWLPLKQYPLNLMRVVLL